ncbi:hypothetical protein PgNI_10978 [Pyricularia grisea]|uniref:Uncharacterized protein n=1 Tax=Pyricularia grisea TaxID=148305 RepID=A0A6P8AYW6_PYRGI|nr:hypothetical protein PgNI_10978 [Pyricularia grisea]TLD07563.1 hypothetical protein PgNI_10978 [Pyricularia grisea]
MSRNPAESPKICQRSKGKEGSKGNKTSVVSAWSELMEIWKDFFPIAIMSESWPVQSIPDPPKLYDL